jgi:predicted amidohydrolase YtcJ
MEMRLLGLVIGAALALAGPDAFAEPTRIFVGGKVITVDDQFSIQQAVAIDGERIVATGSDAQIRALAGPKTEVVDLKGRTMIPGLIDNHNHLIRGTEYWTNEARLEGVRTRAEALTKLKAKAQALPKGQWLLTLGGWYEDQFVGERQDLTIAELDAIAPDRPAFIQAKYDHAFVNTAWFKAMGIPMQTKAAAPAANGPVGRTPDPAATLENDVVRDAKGRVTGRLKGGIFMVNRAVARFPALTDAGQEASIRAAQAYYNSIGLTSIYDPGGLGVQDSSYDRVQKFADHGDLTLRIFYTLGDAKNGLTPAAAREFAAKVRAAKPFQGNVWYDRIAVGEIYYPPFHWDDLVNEKKPTPEDIAAALDILNAAAEGGWSVQTHVVQRETMKIVLDAMEIVNKQHPLRGLRWSFTHADEIGPEELERARKLGVNIQLRSQRVVGNHEAVIEARGPHGVELMPELRLVQDSGVTWGLGTDGTKAAQINPFITLYWAVTGDMLSGVPVTKQHLTRQEALIAHTRSNAMMMFQEAQFGAIKPGLLADLLILDRDYLTVPEDEIKDIKPVATYVAGKLVYGQQ